MHDDARTIREFSSQYVIPCGTQVVLKTRRTPAGSDRYKPAGTVGVVVESPSNGRGEYLVQFADGKQVRAAGDHLALRRREIDQLIGETHEDLQRCVIYRCQVGSKAYGLARDDADDDLRGIYLPPARLHWSLVQLPQQLEADHAGGDEVYWELEKFLRLALKANPNVLETLWTPVVLEANETARELRDMRAAFLSQHLYKTYSGYVLSQFRRMERSYNSRGAFNTKHAMHLLRLLYSGIAALQTGEILVDVSQRREELLQVKDGAVAFDEVKRRALGLDEEFRRSFDRTTLPEQPDIRRVDAFLVAARRRMVDA